MAVYPCYIALRFMCPLCFADFFCAFLFTVHKGRRWLLLLVDKWRVPGQQLLAPLLCGKDFSTTSATPAANIKSHSHSPHEHLTTVGIRVALQLHCLMSQSTTVVREPYSMYPVPRERGVRLVGLRASPSCSARVVTSRCMSQTPQATPYTLRHSQM